MKKIFLLVLLTLGANGLFAQADIHFSQFYETSTLRNPALVGVFTGNYKIAAYYRSQWASVANPYETMLINGEYRFVLNGSSDDFLSIGVLGFSDKAGDIDQKISAVYPSLNFHKSLNRDNTSYLSFGFTGGYLQYSFDPSKATFNNQFQNGSFNQSNPSFENMPTPKFSTVDIGAGINYNITPGKSDKATYMVGVSGYHFTQPGFSYYSTKRNEENVRWNVNGGMIRELNTNLAMQAHINYANQGTYNELIMGALLGWRTFSLMADPVFEIYGGCMFRYTDAIAPVVKMKYKHLSVGISYDVNLSSLKPASNMQGGLELTVSVTGNFPENPPGYRKSVCPRFN